MTWGKIMYSRVSYMKLYGENIQISSTNIISIVFTLNASIMFNIVAMSFNR